LNDRIPCRNNQQPNVHTQMFIKVISFRFVCFHNDARPLTIERFDSYPYSCVDNLKFFY
jgi:hypothetical protein